MSALTGPAHSRPRDMELQTSGEFASFLDLHAMEERPRLGLRPRIDLLIEEVSSPSRCIRRRRFIALSLVSLFVICACIMVLLVVRRKNPLDYWAQATHIDVSQLYSTGQCTPGSCAWNAVGYRLVAKAKECRSRRWLSKYDTTTAQCMDLVRQDGSCSHRYFSHATGGNQNCGCIDDESINCEDGSNMFLSGAADLYATTQAWNCSDDSNEDSAGFSCCCGEKKFWEREIGLINVVSKSQRCIDVKDGIAIEGTVVQVWECKEGHMNMQFEVVTDGMQSQIQWAAHPDLCLEVQQGLPSAGAPIVVGYCGGTTGFSSSTSFYVAKGRGGHIRWVSDPTMCISIYGGSPVIGKQLELASCVDTDEAQMFYVPASPKDTHEGSPSLFCVSLMRPHSTEVSLLKSQLSHGAVGIFACNEWAVYSNESVTLSPGPPAPLRTDVLEGSLECQVGGPWHSALNTHIFIRFWDKVVTDTRPWRHDWMVKVDPDAVFFPDRLHQMLRERWPPAGRATPNAAVFLNNCYLGNHGPLTVLSKDALGVYKDGRAKCAILWATALPQEDVYFRRCLVDTLGVQKENTYNLLMEKDWACTERPSERMCAAPQVAFHPYKTTAEYFDCYDEATAAAPETMYPNVTPRAL